MTILGLAAATEPGTAGSVLAGLAGRRGFAGRLAAVHPNTPDHHVVPITGPTVLAQVLIRNAAATPSSRRRLVSNCGTTVLRSCAKQAVTPVPEVVTELAGRMVDPAASTVSRMIAALGVMDHPDATADQQVAALREVTGAVADGYELVPAGLVGVINAACHHPAVLPDLVVRATGHSDLHIELTTWAGYAAGHSADGGETARAFRDNILARLPDRPTEGEILRALWACPDLAGDLLRRPDGIAAIRYNATHPAVLRTPAYRRARILMAIGVDPGADLPDNIDLGVALNSTSWAYLADTSRLAVHPGPESEVIPAAVAALDRVPAAWPEDHVARVEHATRLLLHPATPPDLRPAVLAHLIADLRASDEPPSAATRLAARLRDPFDLTSVVLSTPVPDLLAAAAGDGLVADYLAAALSDRTRLLWREPAAASAALTAEGTTTGTMGELLTLAV